MRLSLTILDEELSKWNPELIDNERNDEMCYLGAHILEDDMVPLEQHVLLIKSGCNNPNLSCGGYGIISIGKPDQQIINNNLCLIFPKETPLTKLFADIQRIYLKYSTWEEELFKAINNESDIQELCNISEDIFENPILVFDNNLLLLGITHDMPGLPEWDYDEISGNRTFPLDTLNDFKLNKEWQGTMATHGAQMCSENIIGYRVLYHNFWIEDFYAGRICINELRRKITKGEYAILEYFSNILNSVLQRGIFHRSDKSKAFEQSLRDLLEGIKINELYFIQCLSDMGWNRDDSHICIQILMEERDSKTLSTNYTCNRLKNLFPHCFVFPYNDSIIMIINLDKNKKNISSILSEIKIFLREGLFRAGISMVSNDFFRIREYYIQTTLAFNIGSKTNPMYWYYHFDNYIMQAMFYEMSKDISVDMFCERGLFELLKYDDIHQTQLYKTLKVYLDCNMNIAHASAKLFIHRSTLLYRIERINSLINMDINNPDERFKILLSYYLLEWNKEIGN